MNARIKTLFRGAGFIGFGLLALYLFSVVFFSGEHLLALAFLAVSLLALLTYSWGRAYSYRYLFPGLLGFGLFVILPLVYTVYIAFTNFSAANLLTLERVQNWFRQETYLAADKRFDFQVYREGPERFRVLLTDRDTPEQRFLSGPARFEDLLDQQVTADAITAAGVPTGQSLPMREIIRHRNTLKRLDIELPDKLSVTLADLRTFAPLRELWALQPDQSLVNQVNGEVLRPDFTQGSYVDAQGVRVGPGFRVWVGMKNFLRIIKDPGIQGPFLKIFVWNVIFAFLSVFLTFAVGMFLAVLLEWEHLRGRRIYRTLLVLPYAVPAFISILIFKGLFNANFGEVNLILGALFGLKPEWQTDSLLAKVMILIVNTWLGYPYMMIICTGILQSVPKDIYEATSIDGCNPVDNFFRITLPLILPPLFPLLVASFAFNFNNFLLVFLLTGGQPDMVGAATVAGETDLLVTYTFRTAFRDSAANFGYASAIASILFIIVATLSWLNLKYSGKKIYG